MLRGVWCYSRPSGLTVRSLVAWMMIIHGLLYIAGTTGPAPGPAPYDNPTDWVRAPLALFGVLLLTVGIMALLTCHMRCTRRGHVVAVAATALCAFIAGGFYDRFAPLSVFVIMAYAMLGEASAHYERR